MLKNFFDKRYQDVIIIRPLSQLLSKEVVCFAHYSNIKSFTNIYPFTEKIISCPNKTSLNKLTEDFLVSLHTKGFPSTIGAILRYVLILNIFILLYFYQ